MDAQRLSGFQVYLSPPGLVIRFLSPLCMCFGDFLQILWFSSPIPKDMHCKLISVPNFHAVYECVCVCMIVPCDGLEPL